MVRTTGLAAALCCCLSLLSVSSADAGILNGHVDALGGWTGSVAFNSGSGLEGNLDYAVFTAADFNANFLGDGYVPGGPVVYTYQLENTGPDTISAQVVGVANPASTIGSFDIGDVAPFSSTFIGSTASWFFIPGIDTAESSWGLAFSSPNLPIAGDATIVNGGTVAEVSGIPTPGDVAIPEPASLALAVGGAMMAVSLRRRRRS
jgi:hypothetical protein